MKKYLSIFLLLLPLWIRAQNSTPVLWMGQPAVSPNGQWVAFEYKGNLFKVSSQGGNAVPLTLNNAYNGYPVWSHDGNKIAFASDRYGNFDVFVMPAAGGEATRLTYESSRDIPQEFSRDGSRVYFSTNRPDPAQSVRFPDLNLWPKLFSVPVIGGKSILVNAYGTEHVHFNQTEDEFLFQDAKGHENAWRKHHISPVTRDIWLFDTRQKRATKLTDFIGEDREPVWGKGGDFYYLSEREGTQNLFRASVEKPAAVTQLTFFDKNPVRNLSRSETGLMVFTQNGRLFTMQESNSPVLTAVHFDADFNTNLQPTVPANGPITELVIAPDGKEIAFVQEGEVYAAAPDGTSARCLTNTYWQERMISFSPDSRGIVFASEKENKWNIEEAVLTDHRDSLLHLSANFTIKTLIDNPKDAFKGCFAPDGKHLAYLEERNTLKVLDLKSGKFQTVLPAGNSFSYIDGDIAFNWSPDSRHLLVSTPQGFNSQQNVVLLDTRDTAKRINLTRSGFENTDPKWASDGRLIYFNSERDGMRNMSSGSQSDIYGIFLNKQALHSFLLSKEQLQQERSAERTDSLLNLGKPTAITIPDTADLEASTYRLTPASSLISDQLLSPSGDKLYYIAQFEKTFNLYVTGVKEQDIKILAENVGYGQMQMTTDGSSIFILANGKLTRIDTGSGKRTEINPGATIHRDAAAERAYIFKHTVNLLKKRFFDPKLQGIDWDYYAANYEQFLPHINNDYDFELLLSELLGELNSSHTGAIYRPSPANADQTASLGLLFDQTYKGHGLRVSEVVPNGPFDLRGSSIKKGDIIDMIDHKDLGDHADPALLLNHRVGSFVQIGFHEAISGKRFAETIQPISESDFEDLLYSRWVRKMTHLTDSLSKGSIGYIHIRAMDEESLRKTYDRFEELSRTKKAIILDTRFNTGGNISWKLISMLRQVSTLTNRPRGWNPLQSTDSTGHSRPTCVLVSEGNYSDGFNFPYQYQRLHLGKVIGTPVAGTGTGVYYERQIGSPIRIGVPQIGLSWTGENILMENHSLQPDILRYNSFEKLMGGEDEQLETAIAELAKMLNK